MDYPYYREKAKRTIENLEFLDVLELEALGFDRKGSVFCPYFEINGVRIECNASVCIDDVIFPDGKHLHEMFDIPLYEDGAYYCHCPEAAKYLYESIGLINPDD